MSDTILYRRDTAANWTSNNPTPSAGEPCLETDTGFTKIGTGSDNYNSLLYNVQPPGVVDDATASAITLDADSANVLTRVTDSSAVAVTVPVEATTNYPIRTLLGIRMAGTGVVTLTTTSLTINGTIPTFSQHTEVWLRKVGSDEWDVV